MAKWKKLYAKLSYGLNGIEVHRKSLTGGKTLAPHVYNVLQAHYREGTVVKDCAAFLGRSNNTLRSCIFEEILNFAAENRTDHIQIESNIDHGIPAVRGGMMFLLPDRYLL